jgi:hypothetical protein
MDKWNSQLLESLRNVGDPLTDPLVENLFAERGNQGLAELNKFCQTWKAPASDLPPGPIRDFFEAPVQYPAWVDMGKIKHAVRLFYSAPVETLLVLLVKSFPQVFVLPSIADVFYRSDVFNPKTLLRFTIEIAQLIFDLMRPGSLDVDPQKALGVIALQKLRMHHSIIRHYVLFHSKLSPWDPALGAPINQEDLAFGVWGLGIYDLDGFQKLKLGLTPEDEEATFMVWRVIGFLLGLDERLQVNDISQGRELLQVIGARQARPSNAGTMLVRQLLKTMEAFLIFPLKAIPVLLMRSLMSVEAIAILEVPRAHGWIWVAWIVFAFLKLLVREINLLRRLLRAAGRRFLTGVMTAKGRQGQRGQFRVPEEIMHTYGLEAAGRSQQES